MWPKDWSFSFSIGSSNEYSGLISFKIWLLWFPSSPRDSQEPSPTPQFKRINSSALSLIYGPTLTSIHQFSHSVMSVSLWPHGLEHARLPCPSPTPGAYSSPCALSRWWNPTISSSIIPFSSSLQSFPASGSFPMSQLFTSGGQSMGASASASVLPMNIQDCFPLGLTGLILQSKESISLYAIPIRAMHMIAESAYF